MTTQKSLTPFRVFVSSTYEDMSNYRQIVIDTLNNLEVIPRGMEQFVSSPEKSLDVCLSEVRRCQLFIALVAMRYGSVDEETGKSYSELEYDEALKNGIPVLAFVIDENECPVLPKYVDVGDAAEKLKKFKSILNLRYASRFKSVDDLKDLVVRAVKKQLEEEQKSTDVIKTTTDASLDYKAGAEIYRRFLLLPGRYKNKEVFLRIRLNEQYSTWLVKEQVFEARGLNRDDAIMSDNGAYVLGCDYDDIDKSGISVDFFAEGKNADWLLDNNVTRGTIFEGTFRMSYDAVRGVSRDGQTIKVAGLILTNGYSVIGKDTEFLLKIRDSNNDINDE